MQNHCTEKIPGQLADKSKFLNSHPVYLPQGGFIVRNWVESQLEAESVQPAQVLGSCHLLGSSHGFEVRRWRRRQTRYSFAANFNTTSILKTTRNVNIIFHLSPLRLETIQPQACPS